jgi:hypothetical protein
MSHAKTARRLASDEAMARQLAAEESYSTRRSGQDYTQLNYQPRQRRSQPQQQSYEPSSSSEDQQPQRQERDELDQVVEGFKSAAESARKAGLGLFSKLQTKFKELNVGGGDADEQQAETTPSGSRGPVAGVGGMFRRANSSDRTPNQPIPPTSKRVAPALPHGNRYSKPSVDAVSGASDSGCLSRAVSEVDTQVLD